MGSKKKHDSSSDSSSDSDSSDSHSKSKKPAKKMRKRSSSSSEDEAPRKSKSKKYDDSSPETHRRSKHDDSDREGKSRRRRPSSPEEDHRRKDSYRGRHDYRSEDRHRPSRYDHRDDRDRNRRDYRDNRRDDRDRGGRGGRRGGGGGFRGRRDRDDYDHANAKWGREAADDNQGKKPAANKEKPNFGLSGKLTEETNTFRGVVIKYSEPPEARKPKRRWRLYPFKGEKALQTLYIHRESAYLIGRDRKVVDLPVDHPSCSKQHAALQYRLVPFTRDDGSMGKRVRPYLIDLESSNGTFINNKPIEAKKYVELLERDVIKFGYSSREYVLLHENSKDEAQDDDVKNEEEEAPIKEELPIKKEEPAD